MPSPQKPTPKNEQESVMTRLITGLNADQAFAQRLILAELIKISDILSEQTHVDKKDYATIAYELIQKEKAKRPYNKI